jgi:hypothetical protein
MQPTILVFSVFLDFLQEGIEKITDPRSESNGTKFKIGDAMLSAFSMFFMQSQSFLEYQRQLQSYLNLKSQLDWIWVLLA